MTNETLKAEILRLTREYSTRMHQANRPGYESAAAARPFTPGATPVPYAGRVRWWPPSGPPWIFG